MIGYTKDYQIAAKKLEEYNKLWDGGVFKGTDDDVSRLALAFADLDPEISNAIINHENLNGKTKDLTNGFKAQGKAIAEATTKALLMNVALNAAIAIGGALLVKFGSALYDAFTTTAEEMGDIATRAQQIKESLQQNTDYADELTRLAKELENTNLTLEEQNSIHEQMLTIQDSIIEKYDLERGSIDIVNDGIRETIDLLKQRNNEEFNDWYDDAKAKDWSGKSTLSKSIGAYESFSYNTWFDDFGTFEDFISNNFENAFIGYETLLNNLREEERELFEDFIKIDESLTDKKLVIETDMNADEAEKYLDVLLDIVDTYNDDGTYDELYSYLSRASSKAESIISGSEKTNALYYYDHIVEVTDGIAEYYTALQKAEEEYQTVLSTKDPIQIRDQYSALSRYVGEFVQSIRDSSIEGADETATYYEKVYSNILDSAKTDLVEVELKADTSGLRSSVELALQELSEKGIDSTEKIKSYLRDTGNEGEYAFEMINSVADDLNKTFDDTVDYLDSIGYFGKEVVPEVNSEIDNAIKSYQKVINTLSGVREEQDVTGQISTATMMKITALGEDYAAMVKTQTNALGELVYMFDTDAAEKFALEQLQIATNAVISADGTEEQIDALNRCYRSMQPLTSQMEGYIATVKDLDEIQKEVAEGTQYTEEEINELLKKYPQLTAVVDESTGKYKITETSIESLKGKFTSLIQTIIDVKTEMAKLMAVFAAKEARGGWTGAEQWVKLIQKQIKETGAKTIEELEKELGVTFADDLRGTVQVLVDTTPAVDSYEDVISGEKDAADFIYPSTVDKSDPWKEAFEKEYQTKKHALAMEQIDQKAYLDWLDGAYKKYFSDMSKYRDEYYQYEEEVFNGRRALIDEHISDLEKEYEYLGNESKVVEELNTLYAERSYLMSEEQKETVNTKILEYQEKSYRKQIEYLQDKIDLAEEEEGNEELIIGNYSHMIDLLYDIKALYGGIYDESSELMISLDREIAEMSSKIRDIRKELWEAQRDAQVEALEKEQDAIEDYQDAIEDILDATVDYIKRQTEAEIEALEAARDERDEWYDNEIDRIEEVADRRKEALDDELEGYRKIIEAKKESLREDAEVEDYNTEVAKRTKEIADLQSKIDKLALDDSKSAAAERLKLEADLQTKKQDLAKYQRDYSLDQQIEALDKELDSFESANKEKQEQIDSQTKAEKERLEEQRKQMQKYYDDEIEYLRDSLEKEGVLRRKANELMREQGAALWVELREYAAEYTTDVESLAEAWELVCQAMDLAGTKQLDLLNIKDVLGDKYTQNDTTIKNLEDAVYSGEFTAKQQMEIDNTKAKMKSNAKAWRDANNAGNIAERDWYADQNQKLAEKLNETLGEELLVYNKWKGTWTFNGERFFHSGGVAGKSSLKQDELLAVLQDREMILTEPMQNTLSKYINFAKNASFALTSLFSGDPVKNIVNGLKRGGYSGGTVESIHIDKLFDFHADNISKDALPETEAMLKRAADYTIRQMEDRLNRRGIKTKAKTML